ncbi:MAG: hypothetical protein NZ521_06020 [Flammeovirgaceae bacterium]|nr:hypothetical protein [Flammeovirgaceae bacterium]MDW8287582.1 hypothetical protein [Flammeovirgaceae bacterium]
MSKTTISRLLSLDVKKLPAKFFQEHTKELISVYVGYASWEEFKAKKPIPTVSVPSTYNDHFEEENLESTFLPFYNERQQLVIVTKEEYLPLLIERRLAEVFFQEETFTENRSSRIWFQNRWKSTSILALIGLILLMPSAFLINNFFKLEPIKQSSFEILDYRIVHKTDSFAVARTIEKWHLDFWDKKTSENILTFTITKIFNIII